VLSPDSQLLRDHLTLALVPGLGPRLTKALLAHFGSVEAIRAASADQLQQVPHIGQKTAAAFHRALREVDVDAELARMRQHRVRAVVQGMAEYPVMLAQIPDPPYLFYIRGSILPGDANAIAIVGSRQCTAYGRRVTETLAEGLVRAGYTIISGLARGIDGFAHRAAVRAGGRTIAVLPSGLGNIYPPEHAELAEDIEGCGALVSEVPMLAEPQAGSFHARNRIISGLARAVIIVEAGERSGALITANHAAEQGRDVFGVPGPVDSQASVGVNSLLRQGVRLIRGVNDVLEDLQGISSTPITPTAPPAPPAQTALATPKRPARPTAPPTPTVPTTPPTVLTPPTPTAVAASAGGQGASQPLEGMAQRIWEILAAGPRHFDDLTRDLATDAANLSRTLMLMEVRQQIRRLPGNNYQRWA
jgi:DNA processing protein